METHKGYADKIINKNKVYIISTIILYSAQEVGIEVKVFCKKFPVIFSGFFGSIFKIQILSGSSRFIFKGVVKEFQNKILLIPRPEMEPFWREDAKKIHDTVKKIIKTEDYSKWEEDLSGTLKQSKYTEV